MVYTQRKEVPTDNRTGEPTGSAAHQDPGWRRPPCRPSCRRRRTERQRILCGTTRGVAAMRRAALPTPLLILILTAGVFTTGLNITVLGPLVRPIGAAFGLPDAAVGQLSALHALTAGLTAVLIAPWVDR